MLIVTILFLINWLRFLILQRKKSSSPMEGGKKKKRRGGSLLIGQPAYWANYENVDKFNGLISLRSLWCLCQLPGACMGSDKIPFIYYVHPVTACACWAGEGNSSIDFRFGLYFKSTYLLIFFFYCRLLSERNRSSNKKKYICRLKLFLFIHLIFGKREIKFVRRERC